MGKCVADTMTRGDDQRDRERQSSTREDWSDKRRMDQRHEVVETARVVVYHWFCKMEELKLDETQWG